MAGDSSIKCPKCSAHIQFLDIAPDLNMVYFSGRKITYDQLTIGKELGVGGFATVYKGTPWPWRFLVSLSRRV